VESKKRALRRHAGVAIWGARGTPDHTTLRADRTNEQADLGARTAATIYPVSSLRGSVADLCGTTLHLPDGSIIFWNFPEKTIVKIDKDGNDSTFLTQGMGVGRNGAQAITVDAKGRIITLDKDKVSTGR